MRTKWQHGAASAQYRTQQQRATIDEALLSLTYLTMGKNGKPITKSVSKVSKHGTRHEKNRVSRRQGFVSRHVAVAK